MYESDLNEIAKKWGTVIPNEHLLTLTEDSSAGCELYLIELLATKTP